MNEWLINDPFASISFAGVTIAAASLVIYYIYQTSRNTSRAMEQQDTNQTEIRKREIDFQRELLASANATKDLALAISEQTATLGLTNKRIADSLEAGNKMGETMNVIQSHLAGLMSAQGGVLKGMEAQIADNFHAHQRFVHETHISTTATLENAMNTYTDKIIGALTNRLDDTDGYLKELLARADSLIEDGKNLKAFVYTLTGKDLNPTPPEPEPAIQLTITPAKTRRAIRTKTSVPESAP